MKVEMRWFSFKDAPNQKDCSPVSSSGLAVQPSNMLAAEAVEGAGPPDAQDPTIAHPDNVASKPASAAVTVPSSAAGGRIQECDKSAAMILLDVGGQCVGTSQYTPRRSSLSRGRLGSSIIRMLVKPATCSEDVFQLLEQATARIDMILQVGGTPPERAVDIHRSRWLTWAGSCIGNSMEE